MMKLLNLDNWERKEHLQFFSQFEEPYFGICADVDCTKAYQKSKELGTSFFIYYLHKSLVAVNQTEPFRYRIDAKEQVIIHDDVGASSTVNRANNTFGFSYIPYYEDYSEFEPMALKEIERVRNSEGLVPATASENVIHYSAIPWVRFTSVAHARNYARKDSVPKITFGKIENREGVKLMPVSVHVHHGLMDGYHVGIFYEKFQNLLDS